MMAKLEYCERCNKLTEYEIKDETYEIEFQNKLVKYNGKKAVCKYCNSEVFSEEVEDYNQNAFEKEVYTKAYHDLVERIWKPFKDSMTEEEFNRFRCEHTTDDLLNDYEYTFEEEIGYWLEIGNNAYEEYMCTVEQKYYKNDIANELKKFCK